MLDSGLDLPLMVYLVEANARKKLVDVNAHSNVDCFQQVNCGPRRWFPSAPFFTALVSQNQFRVFESVADVFEGDGSGVVDAVVDHGGWVA